jgi:hypothetical protein
MSSANRLIFGVACSLIGVLGRAEDALPKNSPFSSAVVPSTNPTGNDTFEIAAVTTIGKKTSLNIYDRQAKKGTWVDVGATVGDFTVLSYDNAREQSVVRINGVEKILRLRKASAPSNLPLASTNAVPTPTPLPVPATVPPLATTISNPAPATLPTVGPPADPTAAGTANAITPTLPQPPPPVPGSVAHQEQEARMLVSDLLSIGAAQRQAYEEAQKKAQQAAATPSTQPPPSSSPTPVAPVAPQVEPAPAP